MRRISYREIVRQNRPKPEGKGILSTSAMQPGYEANQARNARLDKQSKFFKGNGERTLCPIL
jgi:hypothetical protein